ncbi:MAG: caspase family protein [Chitinophagaceae bacterium]
MTERGIRSIFIPSIILTKKQMKKPALILVLLLVLLVRGHAQTKRALIIAIGNYPSPEINRWRPINALNDVPLIQNALIKQGFPASNISLLTDSMATRKGIGKAFDKLIQSAGPGDVVVIHISSHGEQIEDDNVNEEMDGLDECIVPYGAVYSTDKSIFSKVADGYFRDDEFGEKITQLRNKLGKKGDVLVVIDACHSGTGTRGGVNLVRGNNSPMVSEHFAKKKFPEKDAAGVFMEKTRTKLNGSAATYVVFSGAQAQELNFECYDDEKNPVGSLSYAFSQAISGLEGKITYRTLFARVEEVMRGKAPKQKPVLEGDGIDRELFGGNYVKQQPYITVNVLQSSSTSIILNGGTVSGITPGSVISFYPAGTVSISGKEPLVKGTVTEAGNFTAAVKLEKEMPDLASKKPWAFITETVYGINKIRLGLDSLPADKRSAVAAGLAGFALAEISPACELYIGKSASGEGWALRYANTGSVFADDINLSDTASFKEVLKRYDRFRYLQNLRFTEAGLLARVELVFLDANGNIDLAKLKSRTRFGRLELQEEDEVFLKVINTGAKKFYINIVDVQPDGKINPVIPNKGLTDMNNNPAPIRWEDCLVNRGDSVLFKNLSIRIAPPYGEEVFKVFLSSDPLDLEDILTDDNDAASRSAKGVLNNLAKIFKDSKADANGTRGDGKINTAQNGTIFGVNFTIVAKE